MKQSIITKYRTAGNTVGTRIKATSTIGKYIVINWNYDLSEIENHWLACQALCKKLEWMGKFTIGPVVDGYVFVPSSNNKFTV